MAIVNFNGTRYYSRNQACEALGLSRRKVAERIKTRKCSVTDALKYYLKQKEEAEKTAISGNDLDFLDTNNKPTEYIENEETNGEILKFSKELKIVVTAEGSREILSLFGFISKDSLTTKFKEV